MRQLHKTKRRLCIGAFTVVAAPLLLASVASACTQLANLQANPNSGAAGSTINVTGTRFRTDPASSPGPVEIRLDSRSAAPIGTLPVASVAAGTGGISLSVTIPAAAAIGYHTLIATQYNTSTGALLSGFPVRASYKVTAVASGRGSATEPAPSTAADPAIAAGAQTAPAAAQASAPASPTAPAPGAVSGGPAAPAAAASASASAAAPVPDATRAASVDPATGGPVSPAAATSAAVAADPATAAAAASLGAPIADRSTVVNSGLVAAASRRSANALPGLTFALGAAMVLLSLAAFVKSGRSVLGGRRLTTLA